MPHTTTYNFCTVKFMDGRSHLATVHRDKNGQWEPDKILIGCEWIDFDKYENEDEDNANYSITNYRKKAKQ